jgi:hypothetical protein
MRKTKQKQHGCLQLHNDHRIHALALELSGGMQLLKDSLQNPKMRVQEEGVRLFRRMQMPGLQKQILDPVKKD